MAAKNKTRKLTAMEAADILGVSREQVFTLSRNGVIRRAGYFKRNGKNVTLFHKGDVMAEARRRGASAGDAGRNAREVVRETFTLPHSRLFTEWLASRGDYGLCSPPIDSATAFRFVKDYLLPDGWLDTMPQSARQTDCSALHAILMEHSPRYRREYASYRQGCRPTFWQRLASCLRWW